MGKAVVGVVAGGALALIAATTPAAEAQGRSRSMPRTDMMMLQGGGSEVGISVRDLNSDEIAKAKLAQPGGVLVEVVHEDSPASRAGLMNGDIVVEFDGERVRGVQHFARLVRETPPGRSVTSTILRGGSRRDVEITPEAEDRAGRLLRDLPQIERRLRALPQIPDLPADLDPTPDLQVTPRGQIGITLAPLSDQLASYFGVEQGVLVSTVANGSAAAQGGLKAGDVITAINGRPARSVGEVTRVVRGAKPGSVLEMRVFRDKKETTVKVTVPELITEPRSVQPV
jgi:S1-C subfamily serine protease